MTRIVRFAAVACVLASAILTANSGGAAEKGDAQAEQQESLLVFAAASTKEAVDEVLRDFVRDRASATVKASYGSSAALSHQLQAGAEADLFLSASDAWVDALEQQGLVAARRDLLGNALVAVVPARSKLELAEPADLLSDGVQRLAVGEPESVPAGIYAKRALVELKLWDRLKPKIVGGADVRQALAFVETGAAEAGIVYATDAAVSQKVKVAFALDEKLSGPIVYPLALMKQARDKPAAAALYSTFQSDRAAKIFRRHGFSLRASGAAPAP